MLITLYKFNTSLVIPKLCFIDNLKMFIEIIPDVGISTNYIVFNYLNLINLFIP